MTHNKNYNERMKYKNYDRQKNKFSDKRIKNYMNSERKMKNMIRQWEEEVEDMKFEMEMY